MKQTNPYQTAIVGNPVADMLYATDALSGALQQQQDKTSTDFLSRVVQAGGNQGDINLALNRAVGNGVNPKMLEALRGTTPDADAAAALKAGLDNAKLRADTSKVLMDTKMMPINALSQDLRDVAVTGDNLTKLTNYRENANADVNANTATALGIDVPKKGMSWQMYVESGGNPNAVNKDTGAFGRHQFKPETANWIADQMKIPKNMIGDPAIQDKMKAWYDDHNTSILQKNGVPINELTKFAMHNQGARGISEIWKSAQTGQPVPADIEKNMRANMPTINGKKVEYTDARGWLNAWEQHRQNYNKNNQVPITNKAMDALIKMQEEGNKKGNTGYLKTIAKGIYEKSMNSLDPKVRAEGQKQLVNMAEIFPDADLSEFMPTNVTQEEINAKQRKQQTDDILKIAGEYGDQYKQEVNDYLANTEKPDPVIVEQIKSGTYIADQLSTDEKSEVRNIIDDANIDTNILNIFGDSTGQELMRSAFEDMARKKDLTGLKDPNGNVQQIKRVFERYGIEFGGDETWDLGKDVEVVENGKMDRIMKMDITKKFLEAKKAKERRQSRNMSSPAQDKVIRDYYRVMAQQHGVTKNIIDFVNNIN